MKMNQEARRLYPTAMLVGLGLLALSIGGTFAFAPLSPNRAHRSAHTTEPATHASLHGFQSSLPRHAKQSRLYFFFGNSETDTKEKELAFFPKLASGDNADVKFDSLQGFLTTWAQKFEDDRKGMGLTTPVKIKPILEEVDDNVVKAAGVRIVFQATKTGYKSKNEENQAREGNRDGDDGGAKKKKGPIKEGGVELRVEKLADGQVQLRAKRCDVDEDTMIKEMSEETIVSQLKRALETWKKM